MYYLILLTEGFKVLGNTNENDILTPTLNAAVT